FPVERRCCIRLYQLRRYLAVIVRYDGGVQDGCDKQLSHVLRRLHQTIRGRSASLELQDAGECVEESAGKDAREGMRLGRQLGSRRAWGKRLGVDIEERIGSVAQTIRVNGIGMSDA